MKELTALEKSFLSKDLESDIVTKLTLFLTNTNLDKLQQHDLIDIIEEVYHDAFMEGTLD